MEHLGDTREIALANMKVATEAALYFDRVLPIDDTIILEPGILKKLGFNGLDDWGKLVIHIMYNIGMETVEAEANEHDKLENLLDKYGSNHPEVLIQQKRIDNYREIWRDTYILPILKDYLERNGYKNIKPVFSYDFPQRPNIFPKDMRYESNVIPDVFIDLPDYSFNGYPSLYANQTNSDLAFEISIQSKKFIDSSQLSWDHVFEMRQDKDLMRKFRNFRLFIDESLKGKSKEYIEDKLSQKLDDYENICKKEGLSLIETTYSSLLDSKSALGTITATSMSLLSGQKELAAIIGSGGVIATVAGAVLKIKAKYVEYNNLKINHEMAYIIDLKNKRL